MRGAANLQLTMLSVTSGGQIPMDHAIQAHPKPMVETVVAELAVQVAMADYTGPPVLWRARAYGVWPPKPPCGRSKLWKSNIPRAWLV